MQMIISRLPIFLFTTIIVYMDFAKNQKHMSQLIKLGQKLHDITAFIDQWSDMCGSG